MPLNMKKCLSRYLGLLLSLSLLPACTGLDLSEVAEPQTWCELRSPCVFSFPQEGVEVLYTLEPVAGQRYRWRGSVIWLNQGYPAVWEKIYRLELKLRLKDESEFSTFESVVVRGDANQAIPFQKFITVTDGLGATTLVSFSGRVGEP